MEELLDIDRDYREASRAGRWPLIAPRRFNPDRRAWLPILHTTRGERHHRLHKTRDWVVIYRDDDDLDGQWTVVTAGRGLFNGRRVVRGREAEHRR